MSDCLERIRIVILGGPQVGKSAIIKRFLLKTFVEKYRPTVEDLYCREFNLNEIQSTLGIPAMTIRVDILDTAGDMQFPAMRRLCIANANAFLLVYSITSSSSLTCLKNTFEEIREQRSDFQNIPMVIAGNKHDLTNQREIEIDTVSEWISAEFHRNRVKLLECSAKDNYNIKEIFRSFLILSPLLAEKNATELSKDDTNNKWRRRSSLYLSCTSLDRRIKSTEKGSPTTSTMATVTNFNQKSKSKSKSNLSSSSSSKPRSRSLIRRSSQKVKQQIQKANQTIDDCNLS